MIWALKEEVISIRPAAWFNYENSQRVLIKFGMRRCLNSSLLREFNIGPYSPTPNSGEAQVNLMNIKKSLTFKVIMPVTVKISDFWDMKPYSSVQVYRRFG
jgi:hypothetical protein